MIDDVLLWFGDSYVIGSELSHHYGEMTDEKIKEKIFYFDKRIRYDRHRPDLAFPVLASDNLGLDYYIVGCGGGSISRIATDLLEFVKNIKQHNKKYKAIFALPTQYSRCFYVDNEHKGFSETDNDILKHQLRFGRFETTLLINLIYTTCLIYDIEPYFISVWSKIELTEYLNIVPEDRWLLPKNITLVEKSWDFPDPPDSWRNFYKVKFLERYKDNILYKIIAHPLNYFLLKRNNETFNRYVWPCGNHPNIYGHRMLADTLIGMLREKLISY
jgi:hypothetical protein